jgi:hypothetical protein
LKANTPSTRVISICSLKHKDVWKLTSHLLPNFVPADKYVVYVPANEIEKFHEITNPRVEVLSQGLLGEKYALPLKEILGNSGNILRYGWYLQQFFKIEALLQAKEDQLVIWDADCVPVARIPLFDEKERPIYMSTASEYNEEYFSMIERLLGVSKIESMSFVIPGFPMKREWARSFIQDIELAHQGKSWSEAIISCVDFNKRSAFSETETLGTWVTHSHPREWVKSSGNWERCGQSRFNYARKLTPSNLVEIGKREGLDIISFEN